MVSKPIPGRGMRRRHWIPLAGPLFSSSNRNLSRARLRRSEAPTSSPVASAWVPAPVYSAQFTIIAQA